MGSVSEIRKLSQNNKKAVCMVVTKKSVTQIFNVNKLLKLAGVVNGMSVCLSVYVIACSVYGSMWSDSDKCMHVFRILDNFLRQG